MGVFLISLGLLWFAGVCGSVASFVDQYPTEIRRIRRDVTHPRLIGGLYLWIGMPIAAAGWPLWIAYTAAKDWWD